MPLDIGNRCYDMSPKKLSAVPHREYTALMIRELRSIPDETIFILKDEVVTAVLETYNQLVIDLAEAQNK